METNLGKKIHPWHIDYGSLKIQIKRLKWGIDLLNNKGKHSKEQPIHNRNEKPNEAELNILVETVGKFARYSQDMELNQ